MTTSTPNATLYVKRSMTQGDRWRLCWAAPGDTSFNWAEGECSAITYTTMREAIAAGERRYGETPTKADW